MSNTDKPGTVVADYYRQEAREGNGPWQGTTNTCRSCERPTIEHLEDGWCSQCNGTTPDDSAKRKAARLDLFRRTAKKCREWGDAEGAAWFEGRIKAEGE